MPVVYNKKDWFMTLPNGSEIWIGGIDDKDRAEKILGNEYSTIFLNEVSQISYDAVTILQTRLAENSGLTLRMLYDFNPPSQKHWTYLFFVKKLDPITLKPLKIEVPYLRMNPEDNKANLPMGYVERRLEGLPKKQRDRFLLGLFTRDVVGALWDYEMIIAAQARIISDIAVRTVVAVDPAVTNNPDSDETGIIVASSYGTQYSIDADDTCSTSTQTVATKVIRVDHKHNADVVVVETNQGGDLVENVLRLNGFEGRVLKVHAVKGKVLRAEPVVTLYEQGGVRHAEGLDELESEMMEWVPFNTRNSPNRIDATVYALTELSGESVISLSDLLQMAI